MQTFSRVVRWSSILSFSVLALTLPNNRSWAGNIGNCAADLIDSGVNKSDAAVACADASYPDELASCVVDIKSDSDVKSDIALQSCYSVRRPQELANCVTSISGILDASKSVMALDSCRRSLLPERHAECTLDLTSVAQVSSEEAMKSCIAAELNPGKLAPTN